MYYGPEFISAALRQWAQQHGIELVHIQPGKPTQNAYIERFNRTFRTEVLDRYVFTTLNEVRRMAEDWRHRYNHDRPHRSLGGLLPIRYTMVSNPNLYFRMTRKDEGTSPMEAHGNITDIGNAINVVP